jgi:hypothetical protein
MKGCVKGLGRKGGTERRRARIHNGKEASKEEGKNKGQGPEEEWEKRILNGWLSIVVTLGKYPPIQCLNSAIVTWSKWLSRGPWPEIIAHIPYPTMMIAATPPTAPPTIAPVLALACEAVLLPEVILRLDAPVFTKR